MDDKKISKAYLQDDELCFGYDTTSDKEDEDIINSEDQVSESTKVLNCKYKVQEVEKKLNELSYDDMWGIEFDTVEQCCDFYRNYAKVHGFVARLDEKGQDLNGNINMRQMNFIKSMNMDDKKISKAYLQDDELCFGYDTTSDKEDEDIINSEDQVSESTEVLNCKYKVQEVEKKLNELSYDDMWGIEFDTVEQCCDFYRNYAK
ncbi:hypothetical protein PIB30_106167, partial [Stylosanthes scabra]|nr:hypothetical protein [Stylosanthes scabra]